MSVRKIGDREGGGRGLGDGNGRRSAVPKMRDGVWRYSQRYQMVMF